MTERFSGFLGGSNGLTVPPPTPPLSLGATFPLERWQAWICCLACLVVFVFLANLVRSGYGRAFRAVRDDEIAAQLVGLRVARTQIVAFVVSSACAGVGGGLLVVVTSLAAPGAFPLSLSVALLTGAILGGLGSPVGAVWGAAALVLIPNWADSISTKLSLSNNVQANLSLAIYGAVLIGVVLLAPGGIQGAVRRVRGLLRPTTSQRARGPAPQTQEESTMRSTSKLLALCAAAAALTLSACGSSGSSSGSTGGKPGASAPGITAKTVTVGGHFPLTGPAAPGYSEIPQAIQAYFQWVNAHGGVHGRTLKMIARDDGYNPTNTVKVTKQLVLQDKIFAMLSGLGTPTHTKVVDFLNASRVPDLFVASGCLCWDDPGKHPQTFGWQPDYTREGKILGQYIAKKFPGQKVAYFLQNDDFGTDGAKGLDRYVPKSSVVTRQTYEPGNTDIGPQMAKIKASGAKVVASFSIPAYTALEQLAGLKLNYHPQFVVSNVGSDPITLGGLLKAFSKGKAPSSLIDGIITDTYLPPSGDTSRGWTELFKKVHAKYAGQAALRRQRRVRDGAGLHVRRRAAALGHQPDAAVDREHAPDQEAERAGPRPVRLQQAVPRRLHRRAGRQGQGHDDRDDRQAAGHRRRGRRHLAGHRSRRRRRRPTGCRAGSEPDGLDLSRGAPVPERQGASAVLVPEHADRRRGQGQPDALGRLEVEPAGGDDPQDVPVGEDDRVAVDLGELGDHAVGAGADLRGRLAARRAVGPQRPVGDLLADVGARAALVVAVVPLLEVVAELRAVAEAGQLAGLAGAGQRAGQDAGEVAVRERLAQRAGLVAAVVDQREVGVAGVLARAAPLRRTVADEDDLRHAAADGAEAGRRAGGCGGGAPCTWSASPPRARSPRRGA